MLYFLSFLWTYILFFRYFLNYSVVKFLTFVILSAIVMSGKELVGSAVLYCNLQVELNSTSFSKIFILIIKSLAV